MPKYEFSENNSGGRWWLNRSDYDALFAAGWTYEPSDWDKKNGYDTRPFLDGEGDAVPYGWRHGLLYEAETMQEAVESWEHATGADFFAEGCNCCGAPFSISTVDGDEYISGDTVSRTVNRPW